MFDGRKDAEGSKIERLVSRKLWSNRNSDKPVSRPHARHIRFCTVRYEFRLLTFDGFIQLGEVI